MQNQLKQAINLAKKTGDRIIVVDKANTEEVFVVMSLDEYEKLAVGRSEVRNLTEDELLDKINRDIAIWKSENENENDSDNFQDNKSNSGQIKDYSGNAQDVDENTYYYDELSLNNTLEQGIDVDIDHMEEDNDRKNLWKIPTNIKDGAEEII